MTFIPIYGYIAKKVRVTPDEVTRTLVKYRITR